MEMRRLVLLAGSEPIGADDFRRLRGLVPPPGGWLRGWREVRRRTQRALAAELGCQRQAWAQFELSEERGAISLASLRRAAAVLGCDLVYGLVPREESPTDAARERIDVRGSAGDDELPIELR